MKASPAALSNPSPTANGKPNANPAAPSWRGSSRGAAMDSDKVTEADTYPMPEHGWTCFHCGETFTTPGAARNHFGFDPSCDPACRIKLGAERGLVMALRKAEKELAEAWFAIHNEGTEAAKAYYAQTTRHRAQLMSVEEAGYERGLADGIASTEALREALEKIASGCTCSRDDIDNPTVVWMQGIASKAIDATSAKIAQVRSTNGKEPQMSRLADKLAKLLPLMESGGHPEDVASARFQFKQACFDHADEIVAALNATQPTDAEPFGNLDDLGAELFIAKTNITPANLGRLSPDAVRWENLVKACADLQDDLLARSEWDHEGAGKVVCAGNGAWFRFCDALNAIPQHKNGSHG